MPYCCVLGGTDRGWATVVRIFGMALLAVSLTLDSARADALSARLGTMLGSVASSSKAEVEWTSELKPPAKVGVDSEQKLLPAAPVTPVSGPGSAVWSEPQRTLRPVAAEAPSSPADELSPPADELSPPVDESGTLMPEDASPFWYVPERLRPRVPRCVRIRDWIDAETLFHGEDWTWQVMPLGLMYRSYLAGQKESRFASFLNWDRREGTLWDTALGGRLGLLRWGTCDPIRPEGWQIDIEGGTQARLDPISASAPLLSSDFRIGVPITWAEGPWQFKTGYYHISAHLGDEYILMTDPDELRRLNYVRDAWMLALGYYWTERLRLYAETAYAFSVDDGAEPWEFQFGADWAPAADTGLRGAPFAALNAHLREEVDFGGHWVVQAGWAWRRYARGSLLRTGVQFFQGKSDQYEWYDRTERRIGWGVWADF